MATTSKDFRIYFAVVFTIIAAVILYDQRENFLGLFNTKKPYWCLAFCLLGFSVLVTKLCINSKIPEADRKKVLLRYCMYYTIMLIVMSALSCVISISLFNKSEKIFLASSALLSFFLGFFIDSLSIIVEKLAEKLGGND
ncbi:hypothetical protein [Flavobacterium sp. N1994]|uniref:hypothetical protein n=1 Tax=Flavobacterium sp. N1994 TaxID=2986827 RepID=UPI002223987D|nr:hypothetical protein [Flavobacterium sp. N1994]